MIELEVPVGVLGPETVGPQTVGPQTVEAVQVVVDDDSAFAAHAGRVLRVFRVAGRARNDGNAG